MRGDQPLHQPVLLHPLLRILRAFKRPLLHLPVLVAARRDGRRGAPPPQVRPAPVCAGLRHPPRRGKRLLVCARERSHEPGGRNCVHACNCVSDDLAAPPALPRERVYFLLLGNNVRWQDSKTKAGSAAPASVPHSHQLAGACFAGLQAKYVLSGLFGLQEQNNKRKDTALVLHAGFHQRVLAGKWA